MSNTYFRFKQFNIQQDKCAMKVCTDACILGGWFAPTIPNNSVVLDIGSGTGLLSLMLAQKSNSTFHAVEIDGPCFVQLQENINNSKWNDRITPSYGDIREYSFSSKYDFIIVNPPFYENDLLSIKDEEQVAKHSKQLTLEELVDIIESNLNENGSAGILLPFHRYDYFVELARAKGLFPNQELFVRHSARHPFTRAILRLTRNEKFPEHYELSIHDDNGYTKEFTEILKDYYLYL